MKSKGFFDPPRENGGGSVTTGDSAAQHDDLDQARGVVIGLGSIACIAIIVAVLVWSIATLWPYAAEAMR